MIIATKRPNSTQPSLSAMMRRRLLRAVTGRDLHTVESPPVTEGCVATFGNSEAIDELRHAISHGLVTFSPDTSVEQVLGWLKHAAARQGPV